MREVTTAWPGPDDGLLARILDKVIFILGRVDKGDSEVSVETFDLFIIISVWVLQLSIEGCLIYRIHRCLTLRQFLSIEVLMELLRLDIGLFLIILGVTGPFDIIPQSKGAPGGCTEFALAAPDIRILNIMEILLIWPYEVRMLASDQILDFLDAHHIVLVVGVFVHFAY